MYDLWVLWVVKPYIKSGVGKAFKEAWERRRISHYKAMVITRRSLHMCMHTRARLELRELNAPNAYSHPK